MWGNNIGSVSAPVKRLVLLLQVALDLEALVQDSLGIVVGLLGALVRSAALHPLTDHNHRQHHQLNERLADPLNPLERRMDVWQRDQR